MTYSQGGSVSAAVRPGTGSAVDGVKPIRSLRAWMRANKGSERLEVETSGYHKHPKEHFRASESQLTGLDDSYALPGRRGLSDDSFKAHATPFPSRPFDLKESSKARYEGLSFAEKKRQQEDALQQGVSNVHKAHRIFEENQRLRDELHTESEAKLRAHHALLELKAINQELNDRLETEEDRHSRTHGLVQAARNEADRAVEEKEKIQAELQDSQTELKRIQRILNGSEVGLEIRSLETQVNRLERQLDEKSTECDKALDLTVRQQLDCRQLRETLDTKETEIRKLKASVSKMQNYIMEALGGEPPALMSDGGIESD